MKISKHLKFASVSKDGNQIIDEIEKKDNGKPFSYDVNNNLITKLAQSAPTFHLVRMKFTSIFLLIFVFFYESFCVELSSRHKLGWVRILFHFEFILFYFPIFPSVWPSFFYPPFVHISKQSICSADLGKAQQLTIISKITLRHFITSLLSILKSCVR